MQTRCYDGTWWGPEVVGRDSLLVAARFGVHLPDTHSCDELTASVLGAVLPGRQQCRHCIVYTHIKAVVARSNAVPDELSIVLGAKWLCRYEEDVSWMALHLSGMMPFVVYNTKDSSALHYTPVHNGNEAAAYLQFIVEYYDCLPAYMAFIHAHRCDAEADKVVALSGDEVHGCMPQPCKNALCLHFSLPQLRASPGTVPVAECCPSWHQHNPL